MDCSSCFICSQGILPGNSSTVNKRTLRNKAQLIMNLLHHLGLDMHEWLANSDWHEDMEVPLCCCCEDELNDMFFHESKVLKVACKLQGTVQNCGSTGKQWNGIFGKLRKMIMKGALIDKHERANSDPRRFFQDWRKVVTHLDISVPWCSCKYPPDTKDQTWSKLVNMRGAASTLEVSDHFIPASSSGQLIIPRISSVGGQNVDEIASTEPPSISPSVNNAAAGPSATSSTAAMGTNSTRDTLNRTNGFIFPQHIIGPIIQNQLRMPSRSRNIRRRWQTGQRRSPKNFFKKYLRSRFFTGTRPRSFKCGTCEKVYMSNSARRKHERKVHSNRSEVTSRNLNGIEHEWHFTRQNGNIGRGIRGGTSATHTTAAGIEVGRESEQEVQPPTLPHEIPVEPMEHGVRSREVEQSIHQQLESVRDVPNPNRRVYEDPQRETPTSSGIMPQRRPIRFPDFTALKFQEKEQ